MRDRFIKYRVWDKEQNEWYEPIYRGYEGKIEDLFIDPSGDFMIRREEFGRISIIHESMFPDRFEICEYTGLNDKSGTPIYEGDILSNGQHIDWIVVYDEASFKVKHVGSITDDKWILTRGMAESREVIGTIHSHPHLLEGERSE